MPTATASDDVARPADRAGPPRDLGALALLLVECWRIEAPVLTRRAWAPDGAHRLDYHIILVRGTQRTLVVLADSLEVDRFLSERDIPIV